MPSCQICVPKLKFHRAARWAAAVGACTKLRVHLGGGVKSSSSVRSALPPPLRDKQASTRQAADGGRSTQSASTKREAREGGIRPYSQCPSDVCMCARIPFVPAGGEILRDARSSKLAPQTRDLFAALPSSDGGPAVRLKSRPGGMGVLHADGGATAHADGYQASRRTTNSRCARGVRRHAHQSHTDGPARPRRQIGEPT